MRDFESSRSVRKVVALALVTVLAGSLASWAQTDGVPRMPSGRPDFSGTYDVATLTPLVRPAELGERLTLTDEEAEAIARRKAEIYAADLAPSDPDREAPPAGGIPIFDPAIERASGGSGGYNGFFMDKGDHSLKIDGKWRTSILVEPSNGQLPELTPEAQQRAADRAAFGQPNTGTAWWLDRESGPYDNMEQRPNAERCLVGFTGATPTFPALYNNYKRIVQTEDHVMILIEMVHDARVVRMNSEHPPADARKWLGDSIGWWEGDALVIETTNFHPQSSQGRGGSENLTVIERFTRLENGQVLYRFTVDDPTVWTAPWTGEYVWRATEGRVYEYACHEGNYSFGNIMRGARLLEREALETGESGGG
jgi:hypothetical protein